MLGNSHVDHIFNSWLPSINSLNISSDDVLQVTADDCQSSSGLLQSHLNGCSSDQVLAVMSQPSQKPIPSALEGQQQHVSTSAKNVQHNLQENCGASSRNAKNMQQNLQENCAASSRSTETAVDFCW